METSSIHQLISEFILSGDKETKNHFVKNQKHGTKYLKPASGSTGLPITVTGTAGLRMLQKEPVKSTS
jgi:hypothetical protein